MNYSKTLLLIFLPLIVITLTFCEVLKNSDDDNSNGSTLVVKHWGVDWSTGRNEDVPWEEADGETIGWCEPGERINSITGIWYRSFNGNVYRVGNVALSSVTSVNTSNWATDVCTTPLANGDVWVAECRDGFVKFKVTNQGSVNSEDWDVEVEYQFSTDGNF